MVALDGLDDVAGPGEATEGDDSGRVDGGYGSAAPG